MTAWRAGRPAGAAAALQATKTGRTTRPSAQAEQTIRPAVEAGRRARASRFGWPSYFSRIGAGHRAVGSVPPTLLLLATRYSLFALCAGAPGVKESAVIRNR